MMRCHICNTRLSFVKVCQHSGRLEIEPCPVCCSISERLVSIMNRAPITFVEPEVSDYRDLVPLENKNYG